MKTLTKELWFETKTRVAFIDITDDVQELVRESAVRDGLCLVNAMQMTLT
ncbi:MAG: hypothetical protein JW923_03215 [Spirochaetales bacterium]|nr:hypothetical protein [Spirochaetales bacterium]